MAYPTTIDSFDPLDCDSTENPKDVVNAIQTAVENIETYVGVENSADTDSITYKLTDPASLNPGHKHTLADGATDVTASAAELNYLDGVSPGTAVASKAVVLDANNDFNFGTGDITATIATLTSLNVPLPEGVMVNGRLSVSVSSSDLVVQLLTFSGATPSATNPIYIRVSNTIYAITSALSITLADGTNWFNAGAAATGTAAGTATNNLPYFAYIGINSGTPRLAFARVPHYVDYSDASATTTNEYYLATSGTLSGTDPLVNIGRFTATLSGTATFAWTQPNTAVTQGPTYRSQPFNWSLIHTPSAGSASNLNNTSFAYIDNNILVLEGSISWQQDSAAAASVFVNIPFVSLNGVTSSFIARNTSPNFSIGLGLATAGGLQAAPGFNSNGGAGTWATGTPRTIFYNQRFSFNN